LGLDARGSSPPPPASHLATWIHRTWIRPDEAHRDPLYRRGYVPMAPHGAVSACNMPEPSLRRAAASGDESKQQSPLFQL
jgi:hypothetical protein